MLENVQSHVCLPSGMLNLHALKSVANHFTSSTMCPAGDMHFACSAYCIDNPQPVSFYGKINCSSHCHGLYTFRITDSELITILQRKYLDLAGTINEIPNFCIHAVVYLLDSVSEKLLMKEFNKYTPSQLNHIYSNTPFVNH